MRSGRGLVPALGLVMLLVCPAADLYAQTGTATITGVITDETGATLPGVTVSATNQATNVDYTAVTNESGTYTITPVVVGTYVIKATLQGFRTQTTPPTVLEARQVARLDFKLGVGLTETVEVTEAAPILQTETTTVGEVLSGNTVQSLPLNGRNTGQLALLLPGTMTYNPRGFTNIGSINMNRPFVNGNREQTNNFTVDGLDVNETIDNRVAYQPSPDALSEISVETNNYGADVGNVGGALVSSVIKSGGNRFTGNAFEFYRNSDLDANTWENNRSSAPKQERKQHIFGGTLGGPIVRNRVFFFADYQGSRQDAPGFATASVAPEAWRQGDLSSISAAIIDPATGQPFPGNRIPVERFSPTARAILNDLSNYPLPNRSVTGVTGNFVGPTLFAIRAHQGDARVDWSASDSDKVFARYSFATYQDRRDQQPFPLFLASRNDQPFYNIGASWNRVIGRSMVNELLAGFSHTTVTAETFDWAGIGNANALYGISGGQPVAGLSSIGWGNGLTAPGSIATNSDTLAKTYQINEKLTWLRGRHSLKFGGQFLRYDQQRFYAGNNGLLGFINYNGAFTGAAFADFLLDQVSSKGRGGGDPNDPWTHLQNRISLFAQDDLKVTQALTLNLGLRWAYTSPLVEKDNRQTNFNLVTGEQIFATDGSLEERALYSPYYKGFEPRLGAAFRATDRLVVRGAYGISQFMEGTGANLRLPLNPPFFFESSVNYDRTTGAGRTGTGFAELVPGTTPTGNVRAYDPELRPQFTQQWNAFAEYQLTRSMSAQVGYVGHHATHLVTPVEGNQALPGNRRSDDVGAQAHPPSAVRRAAAHHHDRDDRVARRQQVQLDAGERAAAARCGHGVPRVLHARQGHDEQPRLLRRVRRERPAGCGQRDRGGVLAEHVRSRSGVGPRLPRRPAQPRVLGHLRAAVRPRTDVWRRLVGADERAARRLADRRHLPDTQRAAGHRDRRAEPVAAGGAGRRASELCRRLEARGSVDHALAGSRGLRGRAAGHVRQLPGRRGPRTRLHEHRSHARQARGPRRAAVRRVPARGVQRPESSELRRARAGHLGAGDLRPDHQHGQRPARAGAGVQVLLLTRRS